MQNARHIDRGDLMKYILPQDLKSFGLIPELVGRLPVLTYLNPLDRDALRRILVEPKNSIVKQYIKHGIHHHPLYNRAQATSAKLVLHSLVDDKVESLLGKGQRDVIHLKQFDVPSRRIKKFEVTLDYAKQQLDKAHLQRLESA